jgi:hypothetical protein
MIFLACERLYQFRFTLSRLPISKRVFIDYCVEQCIYNQSDKHNICDLSTTRRCHSFLNTHGIYSLALVYEYHLFLFQLKMSTKKHCIMQFTFTEILVLYRRITFNKLTI